MSDSYSFGATEFAAHVYLKNGFLFDNPDFLEIEMENTGKFAVEVISAGGVVACRAERENAQAGWSTFHFRAGGECGAGVPDGSYKISLVRLGSGTRKAKGGRLEYDV